MFVNRESPRDRLRFSLAHELGHMVMHTLPSPNIEDEADRFAAEFLMPERDIRSDLHDLTLPRLVLLKRYWRVSMAAILKRAEDIGTITANQARYLWQQMGRAGYRTREPVELDVDGEQPALLQELVRIHQRELGYSRKDMHYLLALNDEELDAIYLQSPTDPGARPLRVL